MRIVLLVVVLALCAVGFCGARDGVLKNMQCSTDRPFMMEGVWWNVILNKFLYQRTLDGKNDLVINDYLSTMANIHSNEMSNNQELSDVNIGHRNALIVGNPQWFNPDPKQTYDPPRGAPLGVVRIEELYAVGSTQEELWEQLEQAETQLSLSSKFRHNWMGIGIHCDENPEDNKYDKWWVTLILVHICHSNDTVAWNGDHTCAEQDAIAAHDYCLGPLQDFELPDGIILWTDTTPVCCNYLELLPENVVPPLSGQGSADITVTIPLHKDYNGYVCMKGTHDLDELVGVQVHHGQENSQTSMEPIRSWGPWTCPVDEAFDFCWRYKDDDIGLSSILSPRHYFYLTMHNEEGYSPAIIRDQLACGHLRFDFFEGTELSPLVPVSCA